MPKGYKFWGPVALAVGVTEILGAGSNWLERKIGLDIPWPTISATVGHLEDRWPLLSAAVVGLIAAVTYHALAHRESERETSQGRWVPWGSTETRPVRFYNWRVSIFPAVIAYLLADWYTNSEYVIGYWIYGTLALYGVIIPSLLVLAKWEVQFPTLFATIQHLRLRFPWTAVVLVAGLAILVIHLAFYPWPDITNEPKRYAGLTAGKARAKAVSTVATLRVGKPRLSYSAQDRGISEGSEAWLVFFKPARGTGLAYSGCTVVVTDESVEPTPECSK